MAGCRACGETINAGARFCSSCGAPQTSTCPSCGAAAAGRFCAECGTPLTSGAQAAPAQTSAQPAPAVAERRVTTILFGDLVGFTPLSEHRDAEEVRELLSRYFAVARTVVARYGGTVEKFIGDAVMAVWGVPVAHEDDAERAVRAGLDLVDAIAALGDEVGAPGLAMRVGLVTGEVAVTLGAAGEGMVAGDPVNTAARVQTAAAPGEVWVDELTRMLTAAAVVYADAGAHTLKGKAEPVSLFVARQVVATVGGAQRVDGLEAPFVGRDREMRLVKELFHATLEEGRPRLVAVSGLAGIGKSRLGWEFFKYVDGISDVVRWHRGRCLSYGETVPFWALAEVVRSRLDVLEGDESATVLDKLDAALRRWAGDADEAAWLRPRLATLLGVADVAGVTTPLARDDLFSSWQLFLERLVDDEAVGVALLFEDVQWADDGLLDFVEQLLERSQAPIFILTLARPELIERRPTWATGRRATAIHLEPLPQPAMATLVDGLVEGLTDAARTALVTRSEGVPLYAVETVRGLIDRDAVLPREGRYVVADGTALSVDEIAAPTSLQTLLAARLDALPPAERTTVQNAAVLGQSFTRGALAALTLATGDDADLDNVLDALVRKEILALETDPRSPERGQYRFVQAMVRSVAYETLSRRDRKARHLRAAEYLSADADAGSFAAVLATHYLDARAAAPDDDDAGELARRAVDLLERAAERAQALGSPQQAHAHFRTALQIATDDRIIGRLTLGAAATAITSGDADEGARLADDATVAFERAGSVTDAAEALAVWAEARNAVAMGADVPPRLEPAYAELEAVPGSARARMRLAIQISRAYFASLADATSGGFWVGRASALAEAEEDWPVLVTSLSTEGAMLMTLGRPTAGLGLLRIALDVAREHDLQAGMLQPLNNLATFLASSELGEARGYGEQGLALCERLGNVDHGRYLVGSVALIYWLSGDWDALERLWSEHGSDSVGDAYPALYTSLARLARGEAVVPAPQDPPEELGVQLGAGVAGMLGVAHLAAGDVTAACETAMSALRTYVQFSSFDDDFPMFWCQALDLALTSGRTEDATYWLAEVAGAPRGNVSRLLRALVPYFRARLAVVTGTSDDALVDADFVAAADALREFATPYWHARCLLEHGEWLTRVGRSSEASALVGEAERIFTSLRATPWVTRSQTALALALR